MTKRKKSLLRHDAIELRHDDMPKALRRQLAKPSPPEEGKSWILEGFALKAGVLRYAGAREYNPPKIINAKLAEALVGLPVLLRNRHPGEERKGRKRLFDRDETERSTVGSILSATALTDMEEPLMMVRIAILSEGAKARIQNAGKDRLSLGYAVDLDDKPGTTPQGEAYDCKRTKINPEHLLITDNPRAGDTAGLRTDDKKRKKKTMAKIKIGGVEYETEDSGLAQAAAGEIARADTAEARVLVLEDEATKAKVRVDMAEEKAIKAEADLEEEKAKAEARGDSADIAERVKMCQAAATLLEGKGLEDVLRMDEAEIHRAVNAGQTKKDLSKESDEYHRIRFDMLMEARAEASDQGKGDGKTRQDSRDKGASNAGKGEGKKGKARADQEAAPSFGQGQKASRAK